MGSDSTLIEFFIQSHRDCDERWVAVERAIEGGESAAVRASWEAFSGIQRHHLEMEEQLMFPAFEAATGMTAGPTAVMRMEHSQMRGLLDQMERAIPDGDFQTVLDLGDTLLMLVQQHNQKEEGMLYPMANDVLAADWDTLKEKLEKL
ncbi:MAG TPA: hemerythrin domain-containing protein [Gammaproteobacteria bacterium]|nr:hemerythrin domain-containing protein [Gammaproteobacteria bacterium]MDP7659869.1 hemerythrin domain-containing protein [Gammaproteobacteria bacterium]HJP38605.1 hemerythrin domain-containing protein [Gammaproteobacteria bacterium]